MMKWLLILVVFGIVGLAARRVLAKPNDEKSIHPGKDKYEQTDNPRSTVVVASGPNIAAVAYSVNSTTQFLWSTEYDEEEVTRPEDRWFGIDNIVAGDRIYFRVRVKSGKRVESNVLVESATRTPSRVQIDDAGQAKAMK